MRSLAIALALGALVALFYVATIVRIGGNVLNQAMLSGSERSDDGETATAERTRGAQRRDRARRRRLHRHGRRHGRPGLSPRCRSIASTARRPATAARRSAREASERCSTAGHRALRRQRRRPTCRGSSSPMQTKTRRQDRREHAGLLPRDQQLRQADHGHGRVQRGARAGRARTSTRCSASASPSRRCEPGQTVEMPVSFYVDPNWTEDDDTKDVSRADAVLHLLSGRTKPQGEARRDGLERRTAEAGGRNVASRQLSNAKHRASEEH